MTPELVIEKLKGYCTFKGRQAFENMYGQAALSAKYFEGKKDTYCEILKVIEMYERSSRDE